MHRSPSAPKCFESGALPRHCLAAKKASRPADSFVRWLSDDGPSVCAGVSLNHSKKTTNALVEVDRALEASGCNAQQIHFLPPCVIGRQQSFFIVSPLEIVFAQQNPIEFKVIEAAQVSKIFADCLNSRSSAISAPALAWTSAREHASGPYLPARGHATVHDSPSHP